MKSYLICLIAALLVSGFAANAQEGERIAVERIGDAALCSFDGNIFSFPTLEQWQVLTSLEDMRGEGLSKWRRVSARYARKFASGGEFLFSVPGIVTVYTADSLGSAEMTPKAEAMSFSDGEFTHIRQEAYQDASRDIFIFRSLAKRGKADVLVDRLYMKDGVMLVLMYPIDGKDHYPGDARGTGIYSRKGEEWWDIDKEKLVSLMYIQGICDKISVNILRSKLGYEYL